MKKGEIKKQEILRTAEARFCRYGYEETSIQDILDDLHTSKGSFYHHFTSKESLLEAICRYRAESASDEILASVPAEASPVDILNLLISGLIPFSGEKLSFLLMILPVFSGPQGVQLRNGYMNELSSIYHDPIRECIKKGTEAGDFSCSDPDFFATLILSVVHHYWIGVCDLILADHHSGVRTDPSELVSMTEQYRSVMERILFAPLGSVTLLSLPELINLTDRIHLHLKAL